MLIMTKRKVFNEVFERVCKDNFGIIDIGSMGLGKWQLVYNHRKYYINNEDILPNYDNIIDINVEELEELVKQKVGALIA